MTAPSRKRSVSFVDGENLFNAAKEAFGYHYPNYDVLAFAPEVPSSASVRVMGLIAKPVVPSSEVSLL